MTTPSYILSLLGTTLIYVASAKFGLHYAVIRDTVTLLWPPSGIGLAIILIGGPKMWPGIACGALIANLDGGHPLLALLLITLGNTVESLFSSHLIKKLANFSLSLNKITDVFAVVLYGGALGTSTAATLGTLGLWLSGEAPLAECAETWLTWWLGDSMGILVITPIILIAFSCTRADFKALTSVKVLELLVLTFCTVFVCGIIFQSRQLTGVAFFPFSLTLFPFALWAALRFGSIGAAGVSLLIALLSFFGTVRQTGPFIIDTRMHNLMLWCLYTDLIAITGLIIAALDSGRKSALAALAEINSDLNLQVRQRTRELEDAALQIKNAFDERCRLQIEMNQISEERQKLVGQELHDGLGQQLIGATFLVKSLHGTMLAKSAPEAGMIAEIQEILNQAAELARNLARGMFPVVLETGGIVSALHHLAAYSQTADGIQCNVQCTSDLHFDNLNIPLTLYRIAQEAVANALRHSQAQRIDIRLAKTDEWYRLAVSDNGKGFPKETRRAKSTLGMRSMRSRARMIGASIEFIDNPDGGASVIVTGIDTITGLASPD